MVDKVKAYKKLLNQTFVTHLENKSLNLITA